MSNLPPDAVQNRLDLLERQFRRWRRATFVLSALALVAVVALGASQAPNMGDLACRTVTTRLVTLVDPNGIRRSNWSVASNGVTAITFYDHEGTRVVGSLGIRLDGSAHLQLAAEGGSGQLDLVSAPDGKSSIALTANDHFPRCALQLTSEGTPELYLADASHKRRLSMMVEKYPSFLIFDEGGKPRLSLGVPPDGHGFLALRGQEEGTSMIRAGDDAITTFKPGVTVPKWSELFHLESPKELQSQ